MLVGHGYQVVYVGMKPRIVDTKPMKKDTTICSLDMHSTEAKYICFSQSYKESYISTIPIGMLHPGEQ